MKTTANRRQLQFFNQKYNYQGRAYRSPNLKSRPKYIFIILSFSVLILAVLVIFLFKVKELNIIVDNNTSNYNATTDQIKSNFIGTNILFLTDTDVKSYLLANLPQYRFVKVQKIYPWQLKIYIAERFSMFLVKANNGVFNIDDSYFVTKQVTDLQTKVIVEFKGDLHIGQAITDQALISGIKYGQIGINVVVDDKMLTATLDGETNVLLPVDNLEKTDEYVELLKKIIQKYRIENRKVKIIDLRQQKPLIQFY